MRGTWITVPSRSFVNGSASTTSTHQRCRTRTLPHPSTACAKSARWRAARCPLRSGSCRATRTRAMSRPTPNAADHHLPLPRRRSPRRLGPPVRTQRRPGCWVGPRSVGTVRAVHPRAAWHGPKRGRAPLMPRCSRVEGFILASLGLQLRLPGIPPDVSISGRTDLSGRSRAR
jgi:hypothetical protein